MATNLIKNGTFNNRSIDHWARRPKSVWVPEYNEYDKNNYALIIPATEYIEQRVLPGERLDGKMSFSLKAKAPSEHAFVSAEWSGTIDSGNTTASWILIDLVSIDWRTYSIDFSLYEPVTDFRIKITNPPTSKPPLEPLSIDDIELTYHPT